MTSTVSQLDDDAQVDGAILLDTTDQAWTLTISRPEAHNSMTAAMYDQFGAALAAVERSSAPRALIVRGAGTAAFASGTDISYMQRLNGVGDGVQYERRMQSLISRLECLSIPTVAVIHGHCYGAGMLIAAACDIRIATPGSRFGIPVAKTLGNCLSADSLSLLADRVGSSRVIDMLVRARTFDTLEMQCTGFLSEIAEHNALNERVNELVDDLLTSAPLTVWATKELLNRRRILLAVPDSDVIEKVYTSTDFARGSTAFLARRRAHWTGH